MPLFPRGPPEAAGLPTNPSPEEGVPLRGLSQNIFRKDPAGCLEGMGMDSMKDQGDGSFPGGTHLQLLMGRSGVVWVKKQWQSWLGQRSKELSVTL